MKKKTLPLLLLLPFVAGGCKDYSRFYKAFTSVAPYLNYFEVNDFSFDTNLKTIMVAGAPGCSSVRNGDFTGRNFDFFYNDVPTFVVKTQKSEKRFASIGVGQHCGINNKDFNDKKYSSDVLDLIPNLMLDGVNENGVYINDNVVLKEEANEFEEYNPDGETRLHCLFVPRYVLDHATSADHAVELIRNLNIFGDCCGKAYLHYMICDANKTYIVEFFAGQILVEEKTGNEQVMTNSYCNTLPEGKETTLFCGVERKQILQEHYAEGNSFEGMTSLMKRVQFTKAYDLNSTLYTDIVMQKECYTTMGEAPTDWASKIQSEHDHYAEALTNNDRSQGVWAPWITVHNSVYDIKNKILKVIAQEDYEHQYTFNLNNND